MTEHGRKKEEGRREKYGILVLAALLSVSGCGREEAHRPADRPASRIISLVPAATEMLFTVGAGPQVIAVSSFDHYPPQVEKLARVGALLDPDVERILSLRPDLAVVFEGQEELAEKLAQARIRVFRYGRPKLSDIASTMRELGRLSGHSQQGAEAAAVLERQLAEIGNRAARSVGASDRKLRVMLVIGREPGTLRNIYASGGIGFLADLLRLVGDGGVENAFGNVARENLQVTTEAILAAQPDAIVELVAARAWSAEEISREEHVWDTLSALPAVRHHRVRLLVGDEFVIPGPRVVDAARKLAAVVDR